MARWRWRVERRKGPDLVGEWRPTIGQARRDALAHGHAKYDREHGWFFDVFTHIDREEEEAVSDMVAPPPRAPP